MGEILLKSETLKKYIARNYEIDIESINSDILKKIERLISKGHMGVQIENLSKGFTEENRMKVIEIAIDKLDVWHIEDLSKGFTEENRMKISNAIINNLIDKIDDKFLRLY